MQNDIKRVIAYSTCSQMGYLFLACGLSQYNTALFHLVNHAFFKALLFLSAGAVLHAVYDQQDMRRLGGFLGLLPFTYTAILIGSLSLMAVPFMTGFYSKDLILELAYSQYVFHGSIAYWFGTISAGLTAFYSFRILSMTFLSYPNASKKVYDTAHDAAILAMIPMTILAILAIFFGYITRDLYVGMGTDALGNALFTHPSHISLILVLSDITEVLLHICLSLQYSSSYLLSSMPVFLLVLTGLVNSYVYLVHIKSILLLLS